MTIGPAPMIRIEDMSVRRGIRQPLTDRVIARTNGWGETDGNLAGKSAREASYASEDRLLDDPYRDRGVGRAVDLARCFSRPLFQAGLVRVAWDVLRMAKPFEAHED